MGSTNMQYSFVFPSYLSENIEQDIQLFCFRGTTCSKVNYIS